MVNECYGEVYLVMMITDMMLMRTFVVNDYMVVWCRYSDSGLLRDTVFRGMKQHENAQK